MHQLLEYSSKQPWYRHRRPFRQFILQVGTPFRSTLHLLFLRKTLSILLLWTSRKILTKEMGMGTAMGMETDMGMATATQTGMGKAMDKDRCLYE